MIDRFMLLPRIGTKGNGRCSATYPIVVCMKANKRTHVCVRARTKSAGHVCARQDLERDVDLKFN